MSVASMSEPESSLREDASESDDAARRRLTGLALDSESDAARRDLRFGEELESESEDFERRRDLRFGEAEGEPWRPVSTCVEINQ